MNRPWPSLHGGSLEIARTALFKKTDKAQNKSNRINLKI